MSQPVYHNVIFFTVNTSFLHKPPTQTFQPVLHIKQNRAFITDLQNSCSRVFSGVTPLFISFSATETAMGRAWLILGTNQINYQSQS